MHRAIVRLDREESAATAVEYAIMVVLIAVVIILAVAFIGRELNSDFTCVGSQLSTNGSAEDAC